MDNLHTLLIILTIAGVTIFLRFSPFLFLKKKTPKAVLYLGQVLPYAIMGMLVVYCLKGISLLHKPYGIPEFAAVLVVAGLHKWKHNTLLSILLGTLFYMLLVQFVFAG